MFTAHSCRSAWRASAPSGSPASASICNSCRTAFQVPSADQWLCHFHRALVQFLWRGYCS